MRKIAFANWEPFYIHGSLSPMCRCESSRPWVHQMVISARLAKANPMPSDPAQVPFPLPLLSEPLGAPGGSLRYSHSFQMQVSSSEVITPSTRSLSSSI